MKQLFKDKKYWREMALILAFGIIINALCFCMPLIVHASGLDSGYFPFNSGYNENNINVNQAFIDEQLENGAVFIHCYSDASSSYPNRVRYSVLTDIEQNSSTQVSLYGEILSGYGGSSFALYWDNPNALLSYKVNYYLDWGDGRDITQSSYDTNTLRPFYNISSAIDSDNVYYTKHNINLNSVNNTENVMIYAPAEEIEIGDYTDLPPLEEILNDLTDTYTPDFSPVYPNIDANKTDIENEKSFFDTLSQGITQNFNNLGANLQKFFNKIQQKLTDVANAISTNIHNGFATLMQNLKDFLSPKLNKIIELLEQLKNGDTQESFDEKWNNSQLGQDVDSMSQAVDNCFNVWRDLQEPNEFKIPFHIEYVPMFNVDECQYIDLGLFSPVFPYIRSIMWAFLVYSLMYTIIDSLANYIGGGDE